MVTALFGKRGPDRLCMDLGSGARLHSVQMRRTLHEVFKILDISFVGGKMKTFNCQVCQQLIFFENNQCVRCGHILSYLPEAEILSAIEPAGEDSWWALAPE